MSIQRVQIAFETEFTQLPNRWLRDKRLSRKARGLLAELMTHRVGWVISVQSLVESGPEGRDAIESGLRELKKLGYLIVTQTHGEHGRFETDYMVADPDDSTVPGLSGHGSTVGGQPATKNTMDKEHHSKKKEPDLTNHPDLRSDPPQDDSILTDLVRNVRDAVFEVTGMWVDPLAVFSVVARYDERRKPDSDPPMTPERYYREAVLRDDPFELEKFLHEKVMT